MTITDVRTAYRALHDRALERNPKLWRYIDGLWETWDNELADLAITQAGEMPQGVEFLTRAIANPKVDDDALVMWLDAYPDGVVDRLVGIYV